VHDLHARLQGGGRGGAVPGVLQPVPGEADVQGVRAGGDGAAVPVLPHEQQAVALLQAEGDRGGDRAAGGAEEGVLDAAGDPAQERAPAVRHQVRH